MRRKRLWILAALALLVILAAATVYLSYPPNGDDGRHAGGPPAVGGGAGERQTSLGDEDQRAPRPPKPQEDSPQVAPAAQDQPSPIEQRLTANWSAGELTIVPEAPTFEIARDYNQRAIIGLRNDAHDPLRVTARLEPFDDDLLAGFIGLGSDGKPFTVAPGDRVDLSLYLFAQDARRSVYHSKIVVLDADGGRQLAAAPLRVLVPLPEFDVQATVGAPEPGTLALPVTLENRGQALTDLTVRAGDGLGGRVDLQPAVEHAYLPSGASLDLRVVPRLTAAFEQLQGQITVAAGSQETKVPVRVELPEGMHVFVASSFSTESRDAHSWYCTNRPNVDTPLGGFLEGPIPPSCPDNPYLQQDQWAWQWAAVGPFRLRTIWGDAPTMPPLAPAPYRKAKIPLGISQPAGHWVPPGASDAEPGAAEDLPDGSSSNSAGAGAPGAPANGEIPRVDDPRQVYWMRGTGAHHGPRGLRVRRLYALYRPHIDQDNGPEAMVAYGRGVAGGRTILQAWHSNRYGGGGRQIVFRAWDGLAQHPLSAKLAVGTPGRFGQWPAVLALPNRRALVVWEEAAAAGQPPSLVWRISAPGYASWSDVASVPGAVADGAVGHYDPVAVLTQGRVLLVWQRGTGAAARIMTARSNDAGRFDEATAPVGLPAGSVRPIPRVAANGALYLAFQAPAGPAAGESSAVFVALSRDGGKSFSEVQRVSAETDPAGEPDLLVHDGRVHVAYRAGGDGASQIMHVSRGEGETTWSMPAAVTPADLYAEFPSLLPLVDGVRVEFYGDRRDLAPTLGAAAAAPPAATMIKRYRVALRERKWTAPQRLLTRFPTLRAAWLQVNFRLRTNRTKYRPHTVKVLLNGHELFAQDNVVPEGTFLLPVDPSLLRPDRDGRPQNVLGLRTQHMNHANYSSATGFRLQARHAFLERLVVAASQQEADRLMAAETGRVNHHRHDVGLFASLPLQPLPAAPAEGQTISVPLLLGNLGEQAARDVRVEVFGQPPAADGTPRGERVGESLHVGTLEPMRGFRRLEVPIRYGGKEAYYVVARAAGEDFDPANNVHAVSFAAPQPDPLPPRTPSAEKPLAVATSDSPEPPFRLGFLDDAGREVAVAREGRLEGALPAGRYRLAMTRFQFEGQQVVFPEPFVHRSGEPLRINFSTAVELVVPEEAGDVWRWELVDANNTGHVVQWHHGRHRVMHVPPGDYLVAIRPTQFYSQRLVWPDVISLRQDEHVIVRLGSGIRLATPDIAGDIYSWGLVPADAPNERVQRFEDSVAERRTMLVPPGRYRVAVQPSQFYCRRIVWPATITVQEGTISMARLDSLVRLELAEQAGDIHSWGVVPADAPDEPVQRFEDSVAGRRTMLVPPGRYRVAVRPFQFYCRRIVWPDEFTVAPAATTTLAADSGVHLILPKAFGETYAWGIVAAGEPGEPLQQFADGAAQKRHMLAPANRYRVFVQPDQFHSLRLLWHEPLEVEPGAFSPARLDSGLMLALPEGAGEIFRWEAVAADQPDRPVQAFSEGAAKRRTMLLPPGHYRVALRPAQFTGQRLLWPGEFTVSQGRITKAALTSGIRLIGVKDAERDFEVRILCDDDVVQSAHKPSAVQVVPPGTYRVQVRAAGAQQWTTLAEEVEVTSGKVTELKYRSN